ncbi:RTA1 like protein-domain-containing protein [Amylocarpus encephaloides]|uniref:RTA1 like protein-domain-containing protein n=1 Tax=Amylocarpus encephaloides TaxID=45428 RepID=A0A9P7YHY8_9HELO|nr:RTA1 like protein-domain-containing protein [Amylocarpus encephaloides]
MGVHTSEDVFMYYRYDPSIPACIVFLVLFSVSSIAHIYQLFQTRTWILIPLAIGGLGEAVAYGLRIVSINEGPNYSLAIFIAQSNPTLLGPALFAASIYMCLGRVIIATEGECLSPIRVEWLTKFFVAGDVLGLLVQGAGAILLPMGTLQYYYTGSNIIIAGLGILVLSFGVFMTTTAVYHFRLLRRPTTASQDAGLNWRRELRVLYATSAMVFVRSVYRLVEYSQGNAGWLMTQEWSLYVLDAALMFGVLLIFNIWYPSIVKIIKEDAF